MNKIVPVFDLHADTYYKKLMLRNFPTLRHCTYKSPHTGESFELKDAYTITPERLKQGGVKAQTFSLYLGTQSLTHSLHAAMTMIALMKQDIREHADWFAIVSAQDIASHLLDDKTGILLSIEGLEVIENNLDLIDIYCDLGVRIIAPTWNRTLPWLASVKEEAGPFDKAEDLIHKLNESNVLIDISHCSDASVSYLAKHATKPLIATHSNLRILNPAPRNLLDDQVRLIKDTGGVFGLNFYPEFLQCSEITDSNQSGFEWVYRILDYAIEHFGDTVFAIGTDYDGIPKAAAGLEDPSCFQHLAAYLRSRSVSESTIENLFYKNALRSLALLD